MSLSQRLALIMEQFRDLETGRGPYGRGLYEDGNLLYPAFPVWVDSIHPFYLGPTLDAVCWVLSITRVTCGLPSERNGASPRTKEKPLLDQGRGQWPDGEAVRTLASEDSIQRLRRHVLSFWDGNAGLFRHADDAWPTLWAQSFGIRAISTLEGVPWHRNYKDFSRDFTTYVGHTRASIQEVLGPRALESLAQFAGACIKPTPDGEGQGFAEYPEDDRVSVPTTHVGLDLLAVVADLEDQESVNLRGEAAVFLRDALRQDGTCTTTRYNLECFANLARSIPFHAGEQAKLGWYSRDAARLRKFILGCCRTKGFASHPVQPMATVHATRQGFGAVRVYNNIARGLRGELGSAGDPIDLQHDGQDLEWNGIKALIDETFQDTANGGIGFGRGRAPNLMALWETTDILQLASELPPKGFDESDEWLVETAQRIVKSLDFYLEAGWEGLTVYGPSPASVVSASR